MTLGALYWFFTSTLLYALCAPVEDPPGIGLEPVSLLTDAVDSRSLEFMAVPPDQPLVLSPNRGTLSLSAPSVLVATKTVTVVDTTVMLSATPSSSTTPANTTYPSSLPITAWAQPSRLPGIEAFNLSVFSGGRQNLQVVDGVPVSAMAGFSTLALDVSSPASLPTVSSPAVLVPFLPTGIPSPGENSSSILQILYPAGSVNPATKPQGGAEFYASPLDISDASTVSLAYSVFFPSDFDWVLGGKLPGLYGGHTGCSGGNDALTCFSTRLMWRPRGAGELYLYAPKYNQTAALCDDPKSVCDTTYGLSVDRGSFYFAPGAWTHLRQTVTLNTPGKQDGCFVLEVNGITVINRTDIFYRGVPPTLPVSVSPTQTAPRPTGGSDAGGLFGPFLGNTGLLRRYTDSYSLHPWPLGPLRGRTQRRGVQVGWKLVPLADTSAVTDGSPNVVVNQFTTGYSTVPTLGSRPKGTPNARLLQETMDPTTGTPAAPVSFSGLFFSTFFGGHGPRYATPKDQYVWFTDFAMTRNK